MRRTGPAGSTRSTRRLATRRSPVDLAHLAHLVDTGRLRVPVGRVVVLADVASGPAHAGSGQPRGKVVAPVAAPAC